MDIYGSSNSNVSDIDNSDNTSSRNDSHDYKLNFRGSFWNKKAKNINNQKQIHSESESNNSIENSFNSSHSSIQNENVRNNLNKEEIESVQAINNEEVKEENQEKSNEEDDESREEEEEEEDNNELNENEEYDNNELIEFEEHHEEGENKEEEEENSIRETYKGKTSEQEMNEEEHEILMEDNEYVKEENVNEYHINEGNDNNVEYSRHIHKKNYENSIKDNSIFNDDVFSLLSTDNEIQINKILNKYGTNIGLHDVVYILWECKLFREILKHKEITNINELKNEAKKTQENDSIIFKRKKLEFSFTEQLWIHLNPQNKDSIKKYIFNDFMEILLSHNIYSQEEISEKLEQYLYSISNNKHQPIENFIIFPLSDSNSLTNVWSIPTLVERFISINDNWIINIPINMLYTENNVHGKQEEMIRGNDTAFSFKNECQCDNCKCEHSNVNNYNQTQSQKNVIKINEIKGEYIRQFTFGKKDFHDIAFEKEEDLIEIEFTNPQTKQTITFQTFRNTSPTFIVNDLTKKYLFDKHTKKSLAKLIKQVHNIYFNNDNHSDFNNSFYE